MHHDGGGVQVGEGHQALGVCDAPVEVQVFFLRAELWRQSCFNGTDVNFLSIAF